MTRADLIAALEKAEGPSRKLDYSIRQLVGAIMPLDVAAGKNDGCWVRRIGDELIDIGSHIESGSTSRDMYLPRYTASLDAALMLVPAGRYRVYLERLPADSGPAWKALVRHHGRGHEIEESGHTEHPALCLCIAALKSRE